MQVNRPGGQSAHLPQPDAAGAAHAEKCAAFIRAQIDRDGPMGFATFMQHALYAQGLGYYVSGNQKFGDGGDFVTAPEVSPLFGRAVARQCAEVFSTGSVDEILELGAGSGRLAVDVLATLIELDCTPGSYKILEVSPELAERQRQLLAASVPDQLDRVEWLDRLPTSFRGVVLANEVLDALPVERFVRRDQVMQVCVANGERGFELTERPAATELATAVAVIEEALGDELPAGYVSEVSLGLPGFVSELLAAVESGALFLFDYGTSQDEYYGPERDAGWLRCHYRHHAHNDPLLLPGLQDITAWVNFTAVAEAAHEAGGTIAGFVTQASFLLNNGLLDDVSQQSVSTTSQIELASQVKMLTLPGSMGEHFKCLGLSKGLPGEWRAFSSGDRTHTL